MHIQLSQFCPRMLRFLVLGLVFLLQETTAELVSASVQNSAQPDVAPLSEHKAKCEFKIPPKAYIGPDHLKFLGDFCLKKKLNTSDYSYTVCPFHNVTQLDTVAWQATEVGIGTWQGWIINNGTFTGLEFLAGHTCSGNPRHANILFKCGLRNEISTVNETAKCVYQFNMTGRVFCDPENVKVYPHLSETARSLWDVYHTQLVNKFISPQVHEELLHELMINSGLVVSDYQKEDIKKFLSKEEPMKFDMVDACQREYDMLREENRILRGMTSKESLLELEKQMAELRDKQMKQQSNFDDEYFHGRGMRPGDYGPARWDDL